MVTLISHSAPETVAIGEQWSRDAVAGWIIGLTGDLGAGKTQLVKGLALGLGITQRVLSPTFALVNEYGGGRLPLFHLDLYRLETPAQIHAAGLDEYLCQSLGVTVVEWFERWAGAISMVPIADVHGSASVAEGPRAWGHGSAFNHPTRPLGQTNSPLVGRRVLIEVISENERRISYEDFGA